MPCLCSRIQVRANRRDSTAAIIETAEHFGAIDILKVALLTIARWETASRSPTAPHLRELYHLALEKNRPDLATVFNHAFTVTAGRRLSGEGGFHIREKVKRIGQLAGALLAYESLTEEQKRDAIASILVDRKSALGEILKLASEASRDLSELDVQPPLAVYSDRYFAAAEAKAKRKGKK